MPHILPRPKRPVTAMTRCPVSPLRRESVKQRVAELILSRVVELTMEQFSSLCLVLVCLYYCFQLQKFVFSLMTDFYPCFFFVFVFYKIMIFDLFITIPY